MFNVMNGNEYTNDSILQGISKYVTVMKNPLGQDNSIHEFDANGAPVKITISGSAADNKAAWDRAYEQHGNALRLKDKRAYMYLLGQIMHESGSFKYMKELASGKAYEGRKDLGNIYPGDGPKFKGRGPIQVTGRANYKNIYEKFFIPNGLGNYDIVQNPELAEDPFVGSLLTFGWLLTTRNGELAINACNNYNIEKATKAINGGYNGLEDRINKTNSLLAQLA